MAKRIITISREFGSGGRFIGEEVAKKLGIAYYDKEMIGQIAEQAGVSRGTVDRALNHRGRINPEVAERICRLADEMGYVQKERKHSRTAKDERLKIGVVTQLARSSFMQEVNRGIEKAAVELKEKGIQLILKEGLSVDEEEQLQAIEELEQEGIRGLAIMPVDSETVREKLNALIEEKNIPVVTFNSDIVGTRRTCFVGMDNRKSGRTAAGLLGMLTRGNGKILIITGYFSNHVDNQRVDALWRKPSGFSTSGDRRCSRKL